MISYNIDPSKKHKTNILIPNFVIVSDHCVDWPFLIKVYNYNNTATIFFKWLLTKFK